MSPAKKEYIIVSVVCNEYKISVDNLTKPNYSRRRSPFHEAKLVAMYLLRKHTFFTMVRIGPLLGYSATASTIFASGWVEDRILNDLDFRRRMAKIEAILPQIFNIHK